MAEAEKGSATTGSNEGNGKDEISLKDKGNEFFKAGNYLKAAALYTQAIKLDPSNPTLYSNRSAAFLQLVKLNKALADAETTITLNPQWEKGYFRKGCVLEAMEQYDNALATFQIALQYNPRSTEVSRKIKRISQLAKDKKRAQEVESMRSNVNMEKHLETLKSEMSEMLGSEECFKEMFSFLVETMETAVKSWHEASKVDPRVYFLLDKEKTLTDKYAPVVNIDKVFAFETVLSSLANHSCDAFESPHTHGTCFSFLRQYAEDSFSKAACIVVPKNIISYPQIECASFDLVPSRSRMSLLLGILVFIVHQLTWFGDFVHLVLHQDVFTPRIYEKQSPISCTLEIDESDHRHSIYFGALDDVALKRKLLGTSNIWVWKGQGSRKWRHGQHDGFFVQYESPLMRKIWFIASSNEKGQTLCRDPEILDVSAHEVLPRLFKETMPNP
ncbi:hypothetical protein POTOM_031959 [Populus tomentosa]|uniref:Uncharacterized protein n=1 Tax=Populus tomentosa TaxID=118781 RepID=A0A8X7Z7C4_POPTO|nr:hypothetical protein POTOM_031959 [Populus tomentosa]